MTTTFMGLYGVSSPLPAFYTEDLFKDDSSVRRDFLDIIHQRLYALLLESWQKHQLFIQIAEVKSEASLEMLAGLCGGSQPYKMLRYAGLLGNHPRSVMGLATLLADFLGGVPVDVIPFITRAVKIPEDQQLRLGRSQNRLGEDSFVGQEFVDRQGKFRISIGPLNIGKFRALLQTGEEYAPMAELVRSYVTDPLDYDFELILDGGESRPAQLGGSEWSRLGLDTRLYAGVFIENMRVVFPPNTTDRREAA